MLRHLGYVAMALSIDAATNRTCRLRNATPERLRELIDANLAELERVLRFNIERGVSLYRISSNLIPFASHEVNDIPWWEEHAERFARLAALIREAGLRVTMHPGQFTVLNSPRADVVKAAIAEVGWHVRLLDTLRTDDASKIVIHVGGATGGKAEATARFARVVADLPASWRKRLVIENDERVFSTEDVLDLSSRTGLPMIFDNLHDQVHAQRDDGPSRFLADVFATWKPSDGVPKIHFSTQAEGGRPGHHADWIDPDAFAALVREAPAQPFDSMLECKQKDRALFRLREELRARGIQETGLLGARA